MAVAKIDCPECGATLKPAKPLTPGKKVRCPKCANVFVVPGAEDEEDEVPARKTKAAAGKASRKSAPAEEPPPPPTAKPVDNEEGGIYGFLQERGAEEEAEEDSKPKVEYAPDVSVKNPRGPAVAMLAVPSNGVLGFGALLALLSFGAMCVSIWPFLFTKWSTGVLPSEAKKQYEKEHPSKGQQGMEPKKSSAKREEVSTFINEDEVFEEISKKKEMLAKWEEMKEDDRFARILAAGGAVLAIAYFIVMAFAGVKMQNLESPRWSWAASIMAMLCVVGLPLGLWFYLANEDTAWVSAMLGMLLGIIATGAFPFGLWSAFLLKKPEIEEAFAYEIE
jgi:hypothetical protein